MPIRVNVPNVGVVNFPDGMPHDQITAEVERLSQPARAEGRPQGLATMGEMTQERWNSLNTGQKFQEFLKWGGNALSGMTGMNEAGREAVEHPKTTLATAALGAAVPAAARAIPTRAKAGQQFQQVMGKVGDQPVNISAPGNAALRIQELAERGGSMPKAVRDFVRRVTDPEKAELTYREARDFYSNISRLSADEFQRLTPAVRMEVGKMRVALDRVIAETAKKGGQEEAYRAAMKTYKLASRGRELAEAAAKWTAGAVGLSAAYKLGQKALN